MLFRRSTVLQVSNYYTYEIRISSIQSTSVEGLKPQEFQSLITEVAAESSAVVKAAPEAYSHPM